MNTVRLEPWERTAQELRTREETLREAAQEILLRADVRAELLRVADLLRHMAIEVVRLG